MDIIPAIDLKSGLCVRLYQGDYERETVYSKDPVAVALRWWGEGAPRLHLVDLDGAAGGEPRNLGVIEAILTQVGIPVQVGGGIREIPIAERYLDMGADRVVLGTAAVHDPELVGRLCRDRGADRVVVAVDARDGQVAVKGWREEAAVSTIELARQMESQGVKRFLFTDISRDGTLTSPNFQAVQEFMRLTDCPVLASGGVSSTEHIVRLASIGVEGAIIGSALYTGVLQLGDAIEASKSTTDEGTGFPQPQST